MNAKHYVLALAIAVVLPMLARMGVATFVPAPNWTDIQETPDTSELLTSAEKAEARKKQVDEFQRRMTRQADVDFYVAVGAGVLVLGIGAWMSFQTIAAGFMLGGVILLIQGYLRGWSTMDGPKFAVTIGVFVFLVLLSLKKLGPAKAGDARPVVSPPPPTPFEAQESAARPAGGPESARPAPAAPPAPSVAPAGALNRRASRARIVALLAILAILGAVLAFQRPWEAWQLAGGSAQATGPDAPATAVQLPSSAPTPESVAVFPVDAWMILEAEQPKTKGKSRVLEAANGVAVARDGTVFVCEGRTSQVSVFGPDGRFKRSFGSPGGGEGRFSEPSAIAVAPDQSVLVADAANDRVQRLDARGRFKAVYGGQVLALSSPRGIAVDKQGNIYVADTGNSQIKVLDPGGKLIAKVGERGEDEGQFSEVFGLAVDGKGEVFAADAGNRRLHKFGPLPKMEWQGAASLPDWDSKSLSWSYLSMGPGGLVYVTEALAKKVWIFDTDLKYRGTISEVKQGPDVGPVGIAFDHAQGFWVTNRIGASLLHVGRIGSSGPPVDVNWDPYGIGADLSFPEPALAQLDRNHLPPVTAALLAGTWDPKEDLVLGRKFSDEISGLLGSGDYATLEQLAQEFRTSRQLTPSGDPALQDFYRALWDVSTRDKQENLEDLLARRALVDAWLRQSVCGTALLVKGILETRLAFIARGTGLASEVEDRGWKKMDVHLRRARNLLTEAKRRIPGDAQVYTALLALGPTSGYSKETVLQLAEEGHRTFPAFVGIDINVGYYLLPQWHGAEGELEAYAEKIAARPTGLGEEAYLRFVWGIERTYGNGLFKDTKFDYDRLKAAYTLLEERHPGSMRNLSRWAFIASLKAGREEARRIFKALKGEVDLDAWGKYSRFESWQAWAMKD